MKRTGICAAAMLAVILVSAFSLGTVRKSSVTLSEAAEGVLEAAERGEAMPAIEELEGKWNELRPKLGYFVKTEIIEEIGSIISRLGEMYAQGSDDFRAECSELEERLDAMYRSELPQLWFGTQGLLLLL
ncbi:MAG: DUF4363 family protein [Ruminococcus sp.]|nr:DUF4363 family protein [Ruminococcus sp.]